MTEAALKLTAGQIEQLSAATNQGTANYVNGYNMVLGFIQSAKDNGTNSLSSQTVYWYTNAPQINGNESNSLSNTFIRTASGYGLEHDPSIQTRKLLPDGGLI